MRAPTQYVGFVRNVMVGRKGVSREALLSAFDQRLAAPRSFLPTGNVIFWATKDAAAVAGEAARRLRRSCGLDEPVFVRSVSDLVLLEASHPFERAPRGPHHERTVTFLPDGVLPAVPLRGPRGDVEVFAVGRHAAFGVTRLIDGRPGNPGPLLEKALAVKVTTRNWNTITRLLKACSRAASP